MIQLSQIQKEIAQKLEADRQVNIIEIYADNLNQALTDAAIQFETSISGLNYVVLEKGTKGVMGFMRLPWKIQVEKNRNYLMKGKAEKDTDLATAAEVQETEIVPDIDGRFFLRRFASDIMLKIIVPSGNGKPLDAKRIMEEIGKSENISVDEDSIKQYFAQGTDGVYKNVGIYAHDQAADAKFTLEVDPDEMEARIIAEPPEHNGADVSVERVKVVCRSMSISEECDYTPLEKFIDEPKYGDPVTAVRGQKAENGHDAYMDYKFEADKTKVLLQENRQGNIDFKELNLIQNVVVGQVVAEKVPFGKGVPGRTVYGKMLPAKDGSDIPLPLGSNVSAKGDTIVADMNGKVDLIAGKVSVEALLELDAVSIKSGNVNFNGTLIVRGNVDDGFSVKVTGDLKVNGSVGACNLEAGGNIVVGSGIIGRERAVVKSGKSIWAKFVQSTKLEALENVIASDGIVNCDVIAYKKIVLQGKRAVIAGGRLFAGDEINSRTVGTTSEIATRVETGYDVKKKQRLDELQTQQLAWIKDLEALDLNIKTLTNIEKLQGLSDEKARTLAEQTDAREELNGNLTKIGQELKELRDFLKNDPRVGKIAVSEVAYPGTVVVIKDAVAELKTEVRAVTFIYKNNAIDRVKYEASSLDTTKQI
jgi:uncharacterized protein (DUF342 family)